MAPKDPPADPDRFDEAVAAFRRRLNMSDVEYADLLAQEEARAGVVAALLQGRLVQEAIDGLERAIADGTTLEDFEREAGDALAERWGGADPARMETLFRTTVMQAYNDGRADVFADPDVRKSRPYLRFDAVGDSRTSDICEALDGTVKAADDPYWRTHSPPMHPNCRSILTPLTAEEAGEEGITEGKPDTGDAEPADGFGERVDPENWEPDLSSFDPAVRDVVGERIKK
jgi:SPP1 gp7 family putative phage head morphogenesis protein